METSNSTNSFGFNSSQADFFIPYLDEFLTATKLLSPFWVAIISFGVIANVINIIVFLKTGARDNVTILLLSLAVSDLVFLALISPSMCRFLIFTLAPSHSVPFDTAILAFLFYWPAFTAYDLSTFTSLSLGVMRCACVAMPLKFKFVFTRSRTIKWIVFLVVLAVSLRMPALTVNRIGWRIDPISNKSVPYLKIVNRDSMSRINDTINRGFIIYFSYITMVTCVIILTTKLYQASRIRRACTATSADQSLTKTDDQALSTKDLQVVKSVVLVCTIFVVSQIPFLITSTVRLIVPEFDADAGLNFLFATFTQVYLTCSYLNASLNIFVYFNYNRRFRSVFKSLFLERCSGKSRE